MILVRWRTWMVFASVAVVAPGCALFHPHPKVPPIVSGVQVGVASWYGPGFHGRPTASGEPFDQHDLTAAHPSLPLGSRARVTSLTNHRTVDVRINDRGPFVDGRIIDLSYAAACRLDMIGPGIMPVRLEVLGNADRPAPAARAQAPRPPSEPGPVAPTPPAVAAPARYVVQLGAFERRATADEVQRQVARRFPEAQVTSLDADGALAYRVQLGPYAARRSAEARATIVGRLGYPTVVLPAPLE
jgi:rare lipoprotein A